MIIPSLIIFVAFTFEAIFGWGGGLISIPLLSLLLPISDSVSLVLFFQLSLGLLFIKHLNLQFVKVNLFFIFFLVIGTIIGTLTLFAFNDEILKKILGIFILVYLVKDLFFSNIKVPINYLSKVIVGFFGGVFQGQLGCGGPPISIYFSSLNLSKSDFRISMILSLLIACMIRMILTFVSLPFTKDFLVIYYFQYHYF